MSSVLDWFKYEFEFEWHGLLSLVVLFAGIGIISFIGGVLQYKQEVERLQKECSVLAYTPHGLTVKPIYLCPEKEK